MFKRSEEFQDKRREQRFLFPTTLVNMSKLQTIYKILFSFFGPQHWWPAQTKFEIIVGAILTQNTSWTNVEKSISVLKSKKLLDPKKMLKISRQELAESIRSSGFFNQKSLRLQNFCLYLKEKYNFSLEKMFDQHLEDLRRELLDLNGIGNETADSILLYAGDKPIFVIDAYTFRLAKRVLNKDFDKNYLSLQKYFHDNLSQDVELYNEYHALIVELAKNFCKTKPVCENCPLRKKQVCKFLYTGK